MNMDTVRAIRKAPQNSEYAPVDDGRTSGDETLEDVGDDGIEEGSILVEQSNHNIKNDLTLLTMIRLNACKSFAV